MPLDSAVACQAGLHELQLFAASKQQCALVLQEKLDKHGHGNLLWVDL